MPSNFASSFAPYAPPPDDPSPPLLAKSGSSRSHPGVWFPDSGVSRLYEPSYQSGDRPSSRISIGVTSSDIEQGHSEWETAYGLRVDVLAAFAYLLGPISALVLLVLETHNDYVRFHAYQAALFITPLLLLRFLLALLQFPSWICSFATILLCVTVVSMAAQGFFGAHRGGLSRYHLPKIGLLAELWVAEEDAEIPMIIEGIIPRLVVV